MSRRLTTTYSMLGQNDGTPLAAPQPEPMASLQLVAPLQPEDEFEMPDFNLNEFSDDFEFNEWNDTFITGADAELVEEKADWGVEEQFEGDPEQEAILASFNVQRDRRIREQVREETNAAIFKRIVEILCEMAPTEEVGRLLMAVERQRLLELNAQRQARWPPARKRGSPRARNISNGGQH
jgi:hypothetical protein